MEMEWGRRGARVLQTAAEEIEIGVLTAKQELLWFSAKQRRRWRIQAWTRKRLLTALFVALRFLYSRLYFFLHVLVVEKIDSLHRHNT
jgi:hypothetical protein